MELDVPAPAGAPLGGDEHAAAASHGEIVAYVAVFQGPGYVPPLAVADEDEEMVAPEGPGAAVVDVPADAAVGPDSRPVLGEEELELADTARVSAEAGCRFPGGCKNQGRHRLKRRQVLLLALAVGLCKDPTIDVHARKRSGLQRSNVPELASILLRESYSMDSTHVSIMVCHRHRLLKGCENAVKWANIAGDYAEDSMVGEDQRLRQLTREKNWRSCFLSREWRAQDKNAVWLRYFFRVQNNGQLEFYARQRSSLWP